MRKANQQLKTAAVRKDRRQKEERVAAVTAVAEEDRRRMEERVVALEKKIAAVMALSSRSQGSDSV